MHSRIRVCISAVVAAFALTSLAALTGAEVKAGAATVVEQTPDGCTNPSDQVPLTSVEQVAALLVGTWIRCDGPPLFGDGSDGDIGLDVVGDHFWRLSRGTDGTLIRPEGFDQEGTLTILDNSGFNGPGSYQTNWKLIGRGTAIASPSFFQSPAVMGLAGMTGLAHYARWTGAAPVPGLPPGTVRGACGGATTPITLTSVIQVQDLLVGPWTRCGLGSAIGVADGEAGLEFAADGRFRRLVRLADGTVVPGSDGQEGTWIVRDTTTMNGPGSYQVDLAVDGQGTFVTMPAFLGSPVSVRFVGSQVQADYVRGQPADSAPTAPQLPIGLPPTGTDTSTILALCAAVLTMFGLTLRRLGERDEG
jgi:hypothetical protein